MDEPLDTPPLLDAAGATGAPSSLLGDGGAPAAPKRGRGRPPKDKGPTPAPRSPGRPSNDDKLREKIAELYGVIGAAVMLVDAELAIRIMGNADDLAAAWVKVANESPAIRRLLERLTTTSAIGALVAVHFRVFGPTLLARTGGLGGLSDLFTATTPADVITGPWAGTTPEAP